MKLQKKLSQNKEGKITIWSIIAIILIGVFAWQYGANYLGFMNFTDYISDYDEPTDTITFDYVLQNPISHSEISYIYLDFDITTDLISVELPQNKQPIRDYFIDTGEEFPDFVFTTNAPYKNQNAYYVRVFQTDIDFHHDSPNHATNYFSFEASTVLSAEYSISHLGDILTETYNLDLMNLQKDDYFDSYAQGNYIEIYFYNPSGTVIFQDQIIIWKDWKV